MFALRQQLDGHSKDVRCVHEIPSSAVPTVVTGSRDCSVHVWVECDGRFEDVKQLKDSQAAISAVHCMLASPLWPDGVILTGGIDTVVRCYNAKTFALVRLFEGHTATVCCIVGSPNPADGQFATSSWDCTARLWSPTTGLSQEYVGHTASVWAVAFVHSDQGQPTELLTGSADKTIILWTPDAAQKTLFTGHTDCVRALCVLSNVHFLSSSNDSTIRMWHIPSGHCERIYNGHSHYVYSVAALPSLNWFASCGEDHTVRIWHKDSVKCVQVLRLPCQTVWMICVLASGDIACACSDGILRIFSCDTDRQASLAQLTVYNELVASFEANATKEDVLGNIKVSDLPGVEALKVAGTKDGQHKMVRDARGQVQLYSWSAAKLQWCNIGAVVGSQGDDNAKPTFMGKQYDYVFDVDIADDQPALKLPYNDGDDPWTTAQQFIENNDLPKTYLEEIVNFILKNTSASSSSVPVGNSDPFTGSSSYVTEPQSDNHVLPVGGGAAADPFTGAGRYIPTEATTRAAVIDPMKPTNDYMPLKQFYLFEKVNKDGLMSKLVEFNGRIAESERMSDDNMQSLKDYLYGRLDIMGVPVLQTICIGLAWPDDCLVPVVDCLRLALLTAKGNAFFFEDFAGDELFALLDGALNRSVSAPLQTVVGRVYANSFAHPAGAQYMLQRQADFMLQLCGLLSSPKESVQTAAAAAVANMAYLYHIDQKAPQMMLEKRRILLDALLHSIDKKVGSAGLYRTPTLYVLQSLVTLLWDNKEVALYARILEAEAVLNRLKDMNQEETLKHIARSAQAMLDFAAAGSGGLP